MVKGIIFLIAVTAGCAVYSQKKMEITKIEFSSLSRGGYNKQISCTKDSMITSFREGRGGQPKTQRQAIEAKEWEQLIQSLDNVSLPEILNLKSPTDKRAFDGAMHSVITIYTVDQNWSHSFDDENPHEKLKKLLKLLLKENK